jgi:Flp pilus assembly pilin Flp
MKKGWSYVKRFWNNEEGLGTLEMLLILAIIVIIAIAFRKWIVSWVNRLFTETNTDIQNTKTIVPNTPSP